MARKRVLTGMRPTGRLHLGHYAGALENWVRLQDEYECYFLIADYQALGDHIGQIDGIRQSVIDVTLDWLAVGLNPHDASFVVQSYIPEHAELTMFLSMLVPLSRLQRNPTLKDEMAQLKEAKKELTAGFFNYPVSQVADILLPKADLVPTGEDQIPHIEFTRQVARKFNRSFGKVFPEPRALVGRVPRLVGVDGLSKMSKSANNCVYLSDDAATVEAKVKAMITDVTGEHPRLRSTDTGVVEHNPVFLYHEAFNTNTEEVEDLKDRYRTGRVSDSEVKERLVKALNEFLDPIREHRAYFESRPDEVREALLSGTERARKIAQDTMQEVREAMRVVYHDRSVIHNPV